MQNGGGRLPGEGPVRGPVAGSGCRVGGGSGVFGMVDGGGGRSGRAGPGTSSVVAGGFVFSGAFWKPPSAMVEGSTGARVGLSRPGDGTGIGGTVVSASGRWR